VAAAQLFEALKRPDLTWLEQESDEALATVNRMRDLVGQVALAKLELQGWRNAELPRLVAALTLHNALRTDALEREIEDVDSRELSAEYEQLKTILEDARTALAELK
jgi:hypothetical protein